MRPPQNFGQWDVFIAVQKKNRRRVIFLKKKKIKFTAKFKFSSVPVTRTSFDKRLNDWSIENKSMATSENTVLINFNV